MPELRAVIPKIERTVVSMSRPLLYQSQEDGHVKVKSLKSYQKQSGRLYKS